MEAINVSQLSNSFLLQLNRDLAKEMKGDVVFIKCALYPPLDDEFRVVTEEMKRGRKRKKDELIVILETMGGIMETVERLVAVMRAYYRHVSFVIPNYAYSAGTVLALSGDKILMDYYSVLGPIDPQYRESDGNSVPGYGYLAKYKEITLTINESDDLSKCRAELAYLVKRFDPALLFHIEQGIEHGITLISEWLPKYKFKDWKVTKSTGRKVTAKMKKERATVIAKTLGNAAKWHSHGRGISMRDLRGSEIKLLIDDFGSDPNLSIKIKNYHGLAVDFFSSTRGYIHSRLGIRRVL
ncbi:MAG: hypothetical protein OXC26_09095 [Albidovulum sp.]|nr:hypothetical protein [Albidovulum sp.]